MFYDMPTLNKVYLILNVARIKTVNRQRNIVIRRLINRDLKIN